MKFIHFADMHLGIEIGSQVDPTTALNRRVVDFLKTLDEIVQRAINLKVQCIVLAGDVFRNRTPSLTLQREFAKRLMTLQKNKIPCIITLGNHDIPSTVCRAHTIEPIKTLEPDSIYVGDKLGHIDIGNVRFITVPFLAFEHPDEVEKYLVDYSTEQTVVVGHRMLVGATMGGYTATSGNATPLNIFRRRKPLYVAMGDVHKYQVLSNDPPVVYCGSPERITFGEEFEPKGYVLVTIENGKTEWEFVPLNVREYLTINSEGTHNVEGKIVRVRVDNPKNVTLIGQPFHLSYQKPEKEKTEVTYDIPTVGVSFSTLFQQYVAKQELGPEVKRLVIDLGTEIMK